MRKKSYIYIRMIMNCKYINWDVTVNLEIFARVLFS